MRKPMAFPVRFESNGESVQTTSRDLDEDSVFVRCVEPPGKGESVLLRLYLPGLVVGETVQSVVLERQEQGRDAGFLAGFTDLTPKAQERIRQALTARAAPEPTAPEVAAGPGENRRLLPRFLDRFRVTLSSGQQRAERETLNLSASGLFIQTDAPPAVDDIVQIILELPDGRPPAEAQGIVLRRVMPGTAEPAGAGIQFIGADDAFRARLDAYLENLKGR